MTRRSPRLLRALVATLVTAGLAACTTPGGSSAPNPTYGAVEGAAAPSADLARYYDQQLEWRRCGSEECTTLTVPIDYSDPAAGDIELAVLRVPARDQGKRIGSMLVNPGGPGGSGVSYVRAADAIVGKPVRRYFDLVGFDPRGVGDSAPVDCLDDRALDTFLGTDATPDTPAEEQALLDEAETLADGCEQRNPQLLPHLSTVDAARDMDVLRAALGDEKLTYLGKSYGTFLGATYAELFPERVGRVVLDGVLPPDLTSEEVAEGQARGFEMATRAYVEDCVAEGDCPVGSSVEEGMAWLRDFLKGLDAEPLPSGDPAVPELTESWASLGLGAALYDQGAWGILSDALRDARQGDGSSLMGLANTYADRVPGGGYTGNIMEVIYAVNCLDRPDSPDLATYRRYAQDFSTSAPTWGRFMAWGQLPCGVWPVRADTGDPTIPAGPHEISAAGSDTIVVVGTTRDPATIYEWSKRLADQLDNAVLVSYDGDGHTAYRRSNGCVDDALDAYFVQGTIPEDGLQC